MHDPCTVAFEIHLGRKETKKGEYKTPFITIWHKDPEKHGDDDSCGWFIRSRHIDPIILAKVKKEFEFQFKHEYWFNSGGYPKLSTMGIGLNMYNSAAWQIFMHLNNDKPDRRRHDKFMKKHLFDILFFSENTTDSIKDSIDMKFGVELPEARISNFVSIITADIMRKLRPWYKHPRWHIYHWQITFPLFRSFYRRHFERCSICRKRFKNSSVFSNWEGSKKWCDGCNRMTQKQAAVPQ